MEEIGKCRTVVGFERTEEENRYGDVLDTVVLKLDDGRAIALSLEAGCCSKSHFTDASQFAELVGTEILDAEEREGGVNSYYDGKPLTDPDEYADEVQKWHFLIFTTNKGHVTIDWRNDSNGYYDGSLEWVVR